MRKTSFAAAGHEEARAKEAAKDRKARAKAAGYDPAHEGELAARRDAYRMSKAAEKNIRLTDLERRQIKKAVRNMRAAIRTLRLLLIADGINSLTEADKEMMLRYDAYDSAEVAVNQIKNLL
jgi:hypothetical protein